MRNLFILMLLMISSTTMFAQTQMDLPVTFDDEGVDYGLIGFGGAEASSIVEDPTDPSNTVAQAIKSATAELWAGTTVTNAAEAGFASPVPFTVDDTRMSVSVWSPDAGIQVRLKVEDYLDPTKSVETEATTTIAAGWETLIFDFANEAPGTAALNLDYDMNKASIFFNFGVTGAEAGEKTYYFDDIEFIGGGGIGGDDTYTITFAVDMNEVGAPFTTPEVNGSWDGWCGGCTPLEDPDGDGIWTGSKTLAPGFYEYKFAYDAWAGDESLTEGDPCTITTGGFTNRFIDVVEDVVLDPVCWASCDACDGGGDTYMVTFSVNMNDVAEPFTTPEVNGSWDGWCGGCTPLEDPDGDGIWTGTKMLAAGFYEYKFAYDAWAGDESLTEGDPCTITTGGFTNRFIDVVEDVVLDPVCWATCDICPGDVLLQMDLPVTFEDEAVDYGLIGFGGAEASSIVEDPTDPSNTVAQAIKSATAELWAGTTVTNAAEEGFASPVPFTEEETFMSVRVWSPDADIQVRLKVEDYTDPTKSVETEATVTVAEEWTTLVFDFSNEAPGTAALNLDYDMNKASIFFNFGVTGAEAGEKTYYFDDIQFGIAADPVCEIPADLVVTDVTATSASFDWSDVALADQYVVTVYNAATGERTKLRPSESTVSTGGLEPSTEYGVRVKTVCYDEGIRSENTETVFFTTDPLRLAGENGSTVIYPNPTSGMITIATTSNSDNSMLTIVNVSGQVVYQELISGTTNNVDLSGLADGLYLVNVTDGSNTESFRISLIK